MDLFLQELFDYIALKIADFISINTVTTCDMEGVQQKLGFSILSPVDQAATSSGMAIDWKSFSVDETVGKELVKDMNQALENHGVNMRVSALPDDTIGDLVGGRYYNRDSVAAVTLGIRILEVALSA